MIVDFIVSPSTTVVDNKDVPVSVSVTGMGLIEAASAMHERNNPKTKIITTSTIKMANR